VVWPQVDNECGCEQRGSYQDFEHTLDLRPLDPVRDRGADDDEHAAREELANHYSRCESEGLYASGPEHGDRNGEAERAGRGDQRVRD
jgi:hypothetical protein